jgi:DNA repair protein RadC
VTTTITDPMTRRGRERHVAGPMLRALTYRYQPKRSPAGEVIIPSLVMSQPHTVAPTLMLLLRDEPVEVFGILCLTTKHRVICWHEVARGCLDSAIVHPREVFKAAILANAASVIVAHNHPSGDPEPSPDDLELTRRLSAAGALLGIELLDHLVVGDGSFVSFRQTGRL